MPRRYRRMHALALLVLLLASCGGTRLPAPTIPTATDPRAVAPSATPNAIGVATSSPQMTGITTLNAQQSQYIQMIVEFVRSYDAGKLDAVLALFAENVRYDDCDYAHATRGSAIGKQALGQWLLQRFADHDQLQLRSISVNNVVLAVSYSKRTSDSLRALGFSAGIEPSVATKVVFDQESSTGNYGVDTHDQILQFANASDNACRMG